MPATLERFNRRVPKFWYTLKHVATFCGYWLRHLIGHMVKNVTPAFGINGVPLKTIP